MTRISNADRVLMLLQRHLERTDKHQRKRRPSKRSDQALTALQRIEQLGAISDLSDVEIKRALIGAILGEELGEGVVNDAKFHRIVEDVLNTIAADERASAQLQEACRILGRRPS